MLGEISSELKISPPTPEPLNEKFNRGELLMRLSMDRSSIEHIHVDLQEESLTIRAVARYC